MTIQDLGSIGELLGSILLLVTLIYLALQVSQAKRAMMLSAVQTQRGEVQTNFRALMDSPYLPGIIAKVAAGEELDAVETQRSGSYIALVWSIVYSTWIQRELSDADDVLGRPEMHVALIMTQFGDRPVQWLEVAGTNIYPARFIAWAKQAIADVEASTIIASVEGVMGTTAGSRKRP